MKKPFDICRIGAKVTNEGRIGTVHWLEFDDGIRLVWTPDMREGDHACFYERIEESWASDVRFQGHKNTTSTMEYEDRGPL